MQTTHKTWYGCLLLFACITGMFMLFANDALASFRPGTKDGTNPYKIIRDGTHAAARQIGTAAGGPVGGDFAEGAARVVTAASGLPAGSSMVTDKLRDGFFWIIHTALYLLVLIFGLITQFAVVLLGMVIDINKFSTNEIVVTGWRFTRDALNFVFILAILVIAFAEIAGISGWNIRALLPRLLIAALLVNFSLAIGGVFIDFSRVLTSAFIGEQRIEGGLTASQQLAQNLFKSQAVSKYYTYNPELAVGFTPKGDFSGISDIHAVDFVLVFISIIVIIFITAVFVVATLFLLVRVIGLWILLILSPAGFVFTILPQTKPYADLWWSTFIKYVIYGPVFIFFLVLAGRVGEISLSEGEVQESGLGRLLYLDGNMPTGAISEFFAQNNLLLSTFQTMIMICFIFGGLLCTQKLGIYGGGKAAGMVTGLTGLGMKGVREGTLAGYAGRRLKAGWGAASAERTREAELKQRTSLPGRIGAFARAPFSSETRERATQRSVAERAKQMDESGVDGKNALAAMNDEGKTMVERRANALRAAKLDALDKPEDYQTALKLLEGTKEHANVQRNYRRSHPMLERTGSKNLAEAKVKLTDMKTSDPAKYDSLVKEIQDDVRKAKSDQARDWSGDTIRVMVENKIHPGSNNVRTIMREGNSDARTALQEKKDNLEDHEKTMFASEGGV